MVLGMYDFVDKHKMYEMSTDVYFKLLATEPTDHFSFFLLLLSLVLKTINRKTKMLEEEHAIGILLMSAKSLHTSRAVSNFYGTEIEILAGLRPVGNTEKNGMIMSNF